MGKFLLQFLRQFLHIEKHRGSVGLVFPDCRLTGFAVADLSGKVIGSYGKDIHFGSAPDVFTDIFCKLIPQGFIAETQLENHPLALFIHGEIFRVLLEIPFLFQEGDPGFALFIRDVIKEGVAGGAGSADIIDSHGNFEFFLFHAGEGIHPRFGIKSVPVEKIVGFRPMEEIVRTDGTIDRRKFFLPGKVFQREVFQIRHLFSAPDIIPDIPAILLQKIMDCVMDPGFPAPGKQQIFPLGPDGEFPGFQFRIFFCQEDMGCIMCRSLMQDLKCCSGSLFQMDLQLMGGIFQIVGGILLQKDSVRGFSVFSQTQIGRKASTDGHCQKKYCFETQMQRVHSIFLP